MASGVAVGDREFGDRPADEQALDEQSRVWVGDLPAGWLPHALSASTVFSRALVVGTVLLLYYLLDQFTYVLLNFWLLQELGYTSIFWTNFWMGAGLFALAFLHYTVAIAAPAFMLDVGATARKYAIWAGLIAGLCAGYYSAQQYITFLPFFNARSFGVSDPVFGRDVGFYVFQAPAIREFWTILLIGFIVSLIAAIIFGAIAYRNTPAPENMSRLTAMVGILSNPPAIGSFAAIGILAAWGVYMERWQILLRDNYDSSIFVGPEALDITGIFSILNAINLTIAIVLAVTAMLVYLLYTLHRRVRSGDIGDWQPAVKRAVYVVLVLVAVDLLFVLGVSIRNHTTIMPNEPVVQLDYIQEHINWTRTAYALDDIETVPMTLAATEDPLPETDELLASPTLRNAPLWPGFTSRLERVLDPQHVDRIQLMGGSNIIYGPTQDILNQQQQLRAYYEFLDVDTTRYMIDGEKRMVAGSVREVPLHEPMPWLAWWGQMYVLFTHGHGMAMIHSGEVDSTGGPEYIMSGIPVESTVDELQIEEPSVYYGEGAGSIAFSGVKDMQEMHYPTDDGRAEIFRGPDETRAIQLDSSLKKFVLAWRSGVFWQIFFSGLLTDESSAHYQRTPIDRADEIAPFLFYDSNSWAVVADGRIVWMVNGITTTDRYPYSQFSWLGDKADVRTPYPREHRFANYMRDSVKVTIDAMTGDVTYYQISDEPVVSTWASIYPDLFQPADAMPESVRDQLQYPKQMFHIQFDDLYVYYQMDDAMTFFNMEDMWDDGDEVRGPLLAEGDAISFSIEPYAWIAETGQNLPGAEGETQFVKSLIFTPEDAKNLRAIASVYQDGEDYGKLVVNTIPKGEFVWGPEQFNAAIDQHPEISDQFNLWNERMGNDVIRGHTSTVLIGDELLYIEPIYIRSRQNEYSQLQRVIVGFRGNVEMGETLEEAIDLVIEHAREDQERLANE